MKYLIVLLIPFVALAVLLSDCGSGDRKTSNADSTNQQSGELYTCPMHPSVISDRPGACPVCGMALVRRSAQKELTESERNSLQTVSLSTAQRIMANVAVVPAERRAMTNRVEAVGVVDFAEPLRAKVSARFRGRIEKLIAASTGTTVRKGAPLFEIYSPALYTTQQEYLVALAVARTGDESQAKLSAAARERLLVNYGMTEGQIEELTRRGAARATMPFLSPAGGTIIRKQVTEGQYVDEGDAMYELADLSLVWIYLEVSEEDIRFVKTGQQVVFETDTYPGEEFKGAVTFIDPVLTSETRTIRVRAQVANPSGRLKPRMYVRAKVSSRATGALAVPVDAVVRTGLRNVVWVETRPNTFAPRDVVTGARSDGYYEIVSGLQEGELVAASGGFLIDSESLLSSPMETASDIEAAGQKSIGQKQGSSADMAANNVKTTGADNQKKETTATRGEKTASAGKVKIVRVMVDAEYTPSTITAVAGQRLRIVFNRLNDDACSEEVVFKDFGIRKKLAPNAETTVEFTPSKAGTFKFACGMDMMKGKLIVK
jgi:membrane fusion protein, copper/silver efflux system